MTNFEHPLISLLADHLRMDASDIRLDTPLESLGDSLDAVEVITAAEDEFGINIPEESCASLKDVGDLVSLIQRLSGEDDGGAGVGAKRKPPQKPPGKAGRELEDE